MKKIEFLGAKETLYTEKLDCGLNIYMVQNLNIQNFYITLNVKYGSIYTDYECDGEECHNPSGIAHYLEHLMFKMPDGDAFEYFTKLGSSANAFTSYNVTCYEVFANSKFKENLEYLIKYVYTPYFTKEVVNSERGIISEEIKMYDDNPSYVLIDKLKQNIYVNDKRRERVSGNINDLKEITVDMIKNVYNTFYHPENMFMIITGNFNPEEAIAIINEKMKSFSFEPFKNPSLLGNSEPFEVNSEYEESKMNVNKSKVIIGIKIPKSNFKSLKISNVALRLYLNLIVKINFGSTSILNEEMKSNGIINRSIENSLTETDDYYIQLFKTDTDYPDYFVNRVKDTFDNMTLTNEDIKRKIKISLSDLIWMFDSIESVNMDIQDDILMYNTVLTDIYTIYRSLNNADALKIINKLDKKLYSVNIIYPNE